LVYVVQLLNAWAGTVFRFSHGIRRTVVVNFSKPLSCGLVQLDNFEHIKTKESLSPREGEEPITLWPMLTKGKH
jgi:hypothetical protein